MTLLYLPLALDAAGVVAAAVYFGTDFFSRGRDWWEGLPDAPPLDAAARADMLRAEEAAIGRHRSGGSV